jgi:hypothetical protein
MAAAMTVAVALATPAVAKKDAPGGFTEDATTSAVRSPVMPSLPDRGAFTFPAPYNTTGIRITNSSDCGGKDCVRYVGYSYWRNINNHAGSDTMLILLDLNRARGGGGPTVFAYNKVSDQVTKLGPLFPPASRFSWETAEGWYWSPTRATVLYAPDGAALYRYDIATRKVETVFDLSAKVGNRYIWQTHTSDDDNVHSATLRERSNDKSLGCVVYNEKTKQFSWFPKTGDFDECQVDKSGKWLVIKEQVDNANGEDNVIVNLQTGQQIRFLDQAGAAGHSDTGYGYMVAADNWNPMPGAVRLWHFDQPFPSSEPGSSSNGTIVYHTPDWSADIGHLSHANARPDLPADQQFACGGTASRKHHPRNNEIVCFRLDGSMHVLVVAPVMTNLDAAGGGDDYSKLPKGNLDRTGEYFIWTTNLGGNRLDAVIVKVPMQRLGVPPPDSD